MRSGLQFFKAQDTSSDHPVRTYFEEVGFLPEVVFEVREEFVLLLIRYLIWVSLGKLSSTSLSSLDSSFSIRDKWSTATFSVPFLSWISMLNSLQICLGKIGGELSLEEAEIAAALMDSDGDGLSMEDLVKVVESANEEEQINDLKMAFKMYQEKEGCKTPKSLQRMLSKLGESRTVNDSKGVIARFDVNGDGVLNFDEFRIMMA
nr:calcium-binding protein CML38-like [Tanacetum cinerariifolium]